MSGLFLWPVEKNKRHAFIHAFIHLFKTTLVVFLHFHLFFFLQNHDCTIVLRDLDWQLVQLQHKPSVRSRSRWWIWLTFSPLTVHINTHYGWDSEENQQHRNADQPWQRHGDHQRAFGGRRPSFDWEEQNQSEALQHSPVISFWVPHVYLPQSASSQVTFHVLGARSCRSPCSTWTHWSGSSPPSAPCQLKHRLCRTWP